METPLPYTQNGEAQTFFKRDCKSLCYVMSQAVLIWGEKRTNERTNWKARIGTCASQILYNNSRRKLKFHFDSCETRSSKRMKSARLHKNERHWWQMLLGAQQMSRSFDKKNNVKHSWLFNLLFTETEMSSANREHLIMNQGIPPQGNSTKIK